MSDTQFAYPHVQLLIDGVWRPGAQGLTLPIHDPATDEVLGALARATREDLDAALAAAERGFAVWRKTSAYNRAKLMRKAAEIFRQRADLVAWLITREQGKPLAQAKQEALAGADIIDWFAEEARRTYGQVIPARSEDVLQMTVKQPVGPVAAFTPWNFPINQVVRKLSAAVATGCSIIVKAPEETPASPAELVRAFVDAGIPNGVVNLVYGVPSEISEYLIPHPIIRKISFTGSTAGGQASGRARGRAHEARDDGARRPRARHRLRRRRYPERRQDDRRVEIPQRRAGLRLADALPRRAPRLLRLSRGVHRGREGDQGRQRARGGRRDGPARQRAPHPRAGIADRRRACRMARN